MILCPACSHRNDEGASRCRACGASLEHFLYRECPACGSLNGADRVFCRRCLTHLTQPSEQDLAHWQAWREQALREQTPTPTVEPPEAEKAPPGAQASAKADADLGLEGQEPPPIAATSLPQVAEEALAELSDLLPLEAAVALPHRAVPSLPPTPDEDARADAALFQRAATEPTSLTAPEARRVAEAAPAPGADWRRWLSLAVFLAALAPLLWRGGLLSPQSQAVSGAVAAEIAALGPQDAVLLAFEYTPAYAGELDPLAEALVQALAQRGVRTVALSTQPAGVGLAERAYRKLAETAPDYAYGDDYVILGLLPGQEAGLHALTQGLEQAFQRDYVAQRPLKTWPALYGLPRVDAFHHLVVLSDDEATVRRWVEQVQTRSGVPLDAWVTARIEPLLIPYQRSGQIRRLASGAVGLAALAVTETRGRLDGLTIYWGLLCLTAVLANVVPRRERARGRQDDVRRREV